jgi:hypothetical protein
MRNSLSAVNFLLHNAILVNTNSGKQVQRVFITRLNSVENQTHRNLLPCRASLVPELGLFEVDNITDILHDTVKRTRCQHFVLIVVRYSDEQLRVSVEDCWPQIVSIPQRELVGVTGGRGV